MLRKLLLLLLIFISSEAIGQPPSISYFTPTFGQVGTSVTINGRNFNATAAGNVVTFGGVTATVTVATTTSLTVTVPPGALYKPISVLNISGNLTGYSIVPFIITADTRGTLSTSDLDPKVDFLAGASPFAVCLGDIDGDGKLDMIAVSTTGTTVSIFRNISIKGAISSSSFATRVDIATGNLPSAVALQDVDGDGKPDLIITNKQDNTVSVYHNNAVSGTINTSSFGPKTDFATSASPTSLAIGDIDGDGKPDMLIGGGTASIFLNKTTTGSINNSSFAAKYDLPVSMQSVNLADLDGDGKLDIAGSVSGQVAILHNIMIFSGAVNASSFEAKVVVSSILNAFAVTVADINNDGKPDLLAIDNYTNSLYVYQNATNGGIINSGSFLPGVSFATGKYPFQIGAGDIDGDGLLEVAVANYTDGTTSIYHNTFTGGTINTSSLAAKQDLASGSYSAVVVLGDIDGDGRSDIVVGNNLYNVSVIRNNPLNPPVITSFSPTTGPVGTTVTINGNFFNKNAVANNIVYFGATRATVTSATATQLVVTVPAGATYKPISVLNTEAQRTAFSAVPFLTTYTGKGSIYPADFESPGASLYRSSNRLRVDLMDIDGDGKPDMVTADITGKNVSVWLNTGSAGTQLNSQFAAAINFDGGDNIGKVKIGDIDGDGKPDIVTVNLSTNTLSILRNVSTTGNVAFEKRINIVLAQPYNTQQLVLSDINADGKLDIVYAESSGPVISIFRNTSTVGAISFAAPFITYIDPDFTIAAGDIDGDGKPDLVFDTYESPFGTTGLSVMRNTSVNGVISFAGAVLLNQYDVDFKLADMDNDGKLDIVVAVGNGGVYVLKNIAVAGVVNSSSFAKPVKIDAGQDQQELAYVADIDGDGKLDIITGNINQFGHNSLGIFRNTTTGGSLSFDVEIDVETQLPYNDLQYVDDVALGDIDGDGKPDILASSGKIVMPLYNHPLTATQLAPPLVDSVSPNSSAAGTTVTISGRNFNASTSSNVVSFGDVAVKPTSASANSLTVTVPTAATYKRLSVLNTATRLSGYSPEVPFNLTFPSKHDIKASDFKAPYNLSTLYGTNTTVFNAGITLCDVDGDGKLDLVAGNEPFNGSYKISVYRNTATAGSAINAASFGPKIDVDASGYNTVIMQDMDGDGKPDMLLTLGSSTSGYYYYVRKNTSIAGNITFDQAIPINIPGTGGPAAIGDLDGDGFPDVIAGGDSFSGTISVTQNLSLRKPLTFGMIKQFKVSSGVTAVFTADIDGDGKLDILASTNDGYLCVLLNTSKPGTINSVSFAPYVSFKVDKYAASVTLGDIDGDGKMDIVLTSVVNPTVFSIMRNSSTPGNVKFDTRVDIPSTASPNSLTIGDMDGDGKPDIIACTSTGLAIFRNTSTSGTVSMGGETDLSTTALGTLVGDVDGDGKPDLVLTYYSNQIVFIQNSPVAPTALPTITSFTPTTGSTGTITTVTGTNLGTVNTVSFGGVAASSFTVNSATSITAVVGSGASGSVSATSPPGTASLGGFTYGVSLPATNFTISTVSATCKGTANGAVNITAVQNLSYVATLTGNGVNVVTPFNTTAAFNNLAAGIYSVCITVSGQPTYQQCYSLVITEPKDLSLYTVVSPDNKTISLALSGGGTYNIQLNGVLRSTTDSVVTLTLTAGKNDLVVTTDKLCQGVVEKVITATDIVVPYPNPFENVLYLNVGNQKVTNATVEVYSTIGVLVYKKQFSHPDNTIQINLSSIKMIGQYTLKLTTDNAQRIFKIIKK